MYNNAPTDQPAGILMSSHRLLNELSINCSLAVGEGIRIFVINGKMESKEKLKVP